MMRAKEKWEPAMVIAICQDKPCSYIINTPGGKRYRRNRHHLKPTPASWNARLRHHSDQNCNDWLDDASVINETNSTETEIPMTQSNSADLKEQSENHLGTLTQTIDHNL